MDLIRKMIFYILVVMYSFIIVLPAAGYALQYYRKTGDYSSDDWIFKNRITKIIYSIYPS